MNIPFPSLLKELVDYNPPIFKRAKAWRVFRLCIKNGKVELAQRIFDKYLSNSQGSDFAIATGFALMAQKQNKI